MKKIQIIFLIIILLVVALAFKFGLLEYLTLANLKAQQINLQVYYQAHPVITISAYMLIYIVTTALSLPGATILTLAGGGVFGLYLGTLIVSFASTIGASIAFLVARFGFRDLVQAKFGTKLKVLYAGVEREGALYLFSLRLVPIMPFFLINLLMGLTNIKLRTFYWVSQIGMLAGTIIYVNAGTQLAKIGSLENILTPKLILSLMLLAGFSWVTKFLLNLFKQGK